MQSRFLSVALRIFALLLFASLPAIGQAEPPQNEKVPWRLTVVVMDGVDSIEHAETPVKEAVAFIESHSKLKFEVEYRLDFSYHEYTPYMVGPDRDGDGRGDETAYAMMGWNLPKALIKSLPVSDSYLFLYKMFGNRPLQAGSALPLSYGMRKGGISRAYATVPADQWWFKNEPFEGFNSRAAQIVTHEIINTVQAKIEAPPFRCAKLIPLKDWAPTALEESRRSFLYEGARLSRLEGCYAKIRRIDASRNAQKQQR